MILYAGTYILIVGVAVVALGLIGANIISEYSAAPYVPTKDREVQNMYDIAQIKPDDVVFDLGSGDGRLLIKAAQCGARCVGYEIHPLWWLVSNMKIRAHNVNHQVTVYRRSLWDADLSQPTVIFCYLLPPAIKRLERLLLRDAKPGTLIISNTFEFDTLTMVETKGVAKKFIIPDDTTKKNHKN